MSNNSDFDDPFASIEDDFDELDDSGEGFEIDEGGLDGSGSEELESDFDEVDSNDFAESPAAPSSGNTQSNQAQAVQSKTAETKPFIKTPLGMAVAGACVIVVGLTGAVVISALSSEPEYEPVMAEPMPSFGTEQIDAGAAPGLPATATAPALAPVPAPVFAEEAPSIQQQLAEVKANREQAVPIIEAGVQPAQSTEQAAELSKAVERAREETAEVKKSIMLVNQSIARLSKHVEDNEKEHQKLAVQVQAMGEVLGSFANGKAPASVAKAESQSVPAPVAEPKEVVVKTVRELRQRLSDLQVIETTESGKMTVVKKASNGRVFTLFKGEKIRTPYGAFAVEDIQEDGNLILIGSKYFIDKELVKVKPKTVVLDSPAPAKKVKREAPSAPRVATSYTVNAVYDGGNAFGLVNESGDFKTYNKGDSIPGLGVVHGLDSSGNLKVGNAIIKSVY